MAIEDKIELASEAIDLKNKESNKIDRRNFLKSLGGISGASALAAFLTNCKKSPEGPSIPPTSDEYTVTVDCYDMTGLNGDNFADYVSVPGAKVITNGTVQSPGVYTFAHKGHSLSLDFTGSVHDAVLCVRKLGSSTNLYQTQNGLPANINLANLGQGNNVHLQLYKIPSSSWMNIHGVKEALKKGTAIYNRDVAVYLVNEGYLNGDWAGAKSLATRNIKNALNQINPCLTGITAVLDENASSGLLKVRLSPAYYNPTHGEKVNNGIIQDSDVTIRHDSTGREYLEELYQALGVRHDIFPGGLSDDISNDTDRLNRFGKGLMRINYMLNPNTNLG